MAESEITQWRTSTERMHLRKTLSSTQNHDSLGAETIILNWGREPTQDSEALAAWKKPSPAAQPVLLASGSENLVQETFDAREAFTPVYGI